MYRFQKFVYYKPWKRPSAIFFYQTYNFFLAQLVNFQNNMSRWKNKRIYNTHSHYNIILDTYSIPYNIFIYLHMFDINYNKIFSLTTRTWTRFNPFCKTLIFKTDLKTIRNKIKIKKNTCSIRDFFAFKSFVVGT